MATHNSKETKVPARYTPGPYTFYKHSDGCDDFWFIVPRADETKTIASILFWDDDEQWSAQAKANARLLASAPELVEVIYGFFSVGSINHHASRDGIYARAQRVLAYILEGAKRNDRLP